jgi:hypothetical protein
VTANNLADALNRSCHCISVDPDALRASLESRLGGADVVARLRETHPHLLADSPVFISRRHIDGMRDMIASIERVVATEAYQDRVLQWVPEIARFDHGTHGVFIGYDFHLAQDGPKLIEINTNAGGALLLLHLASAQQACCAEVDEFVVGHTGLDDFEDRFVAMFRRELEAQSPDQVLRRIAIVDEDPGGQYLAPEFELFEQMFERCGIDAVIVAPDMLARDGDRLLADGAPVDLVYNRLTDFYLQSPACAALATTCRYGGAVITPGPHTHALYANKRNLTLLCDRVAGVPKTELVSADNADRLWAERKKLFFKPNWGYGSRGAYSGAKLTRGKWEEILASEYVAQELVPPSERLVIRDGGKKALKVDVRCYVYDGDIQLLGARLYRGQTTNFRTGGGGLATVFMAAEP